MGRTSLSSAPGREFNEKCHNICAREIGEQLNAMGGIDLMRAAGYRVAYSLGSAKGRELEYAWNQIGHWKA